MSCLLTGCLSFSIDTTKLSTLNLSDCSAGIATTFSRPLFCLVKIYFSLDTILRQIGQHTLVLLSASKCCLSCYTCYRYTFLASVFLICLLYFPISRFWSETFDFHCLDLYVLVFVSVFLPYYSVFTGFLFVLLTSPLSSKWLKTCLESFNNSSISNIISVTINKIISNNKHN